MTSPFQTVHGIEVPMLSADTAKQVTTSRLIRPATGRDLAAINDIYNHYVLNSTCTYQEEPETLAAREQWLRAHDSAHPIVVLECHGQVVGWGSLSPYHSRCAYRRTVENSVYVHHEFHRRGIGSAILADLIARAQASDHHAIIAAIDGEQTGSVALHERFGFREVGHFKEVGLKFGRWLDVIYMELILGSGAGAQPDPG
jgi:phosphinothricin acetyltransferase